MTLREMAEHRRAVRLFDPDKPIDPEVVKSCIETAALTPTSSNMQLWEAIHITDPALIARVAADCLGQHAVSTASQVVVFVARPDLYRSHARDVLEFER